MIIRLTLVLTVGIVGSMLIYGSEQSNVAKPPIESTVLGPAVKATDEVRIENVVAASFEPATVANAPKPVVAPTAKRVVVETAQTTVEVTMQDTLDLASVAPSDEAIENAVAEAILPQSDIRYVTGSRVNLRAGPSTSNAVVARLLRGTETEVLDVVGDGWLQIRDVATGTEGYMSGDFLSVENPG